MRPLSRLGTVTMLLAAIAVSHDAYASVSYTYDNQGRVITAAYSNGTTITYTYDTTGNITSRQVTCGNSGC